MRPTVSLQIRFAGASTSSVWDVHCNLAVSPNGEPIPMSASVLATRLVMPALLSVRRRMRAHHRSAQTLGAVPDFRSGVLQVVQQALGGRQKAHTCFGKRQLARGAVKKGGAQLRLELLNGPRQRRLAQVQLLAGARDIARSRSRDEQPELALREIHALYL